jgi:hypothetical protein
MRVLTFISIVFLGSAVTALPLTTSMPLRLIIYTYLTDKCHVAEGDAAVVKRQCGPPPPLGSHFNERCIPIADA